MCQLSVNVLFFNIIILLQSKQFPQIPKLTLIKLISKIRVILKKI